MTCGLHGKLDTAVAAVKTALTTALDADIAEKDLEDILAAYTNLKSVAKRVPTGITFVPDTTLGDTLQFDSDINIETSDYVGAAETVTFGGDHIAGLGSDVITFGDDIDKDIWLGVTPPLGVDRNLIFAI